MREVDAEAKGQEKVTAGDLSPMVDATKESSTPLDPIAMMDPAEFRIADRILKFAGCVTFAVTTAKILKDKGELAFIGPTLEKNTLKTEVEFTFDSITAPSKTPDKGARIVPF